MFDQADGLERRCFGQRRGDQGADQPRRESRRDHSGASLCFTGGERRLRRLLHAARLTAVMTARNRATTAVSAEFSGPPDTSKYHQTSNVSRATPNSARGGKASAPSTPPMPA